MPEIPVDESYNPFETRQIEKPAGIRKRDTPPEGWETLYPEPKKIWQEPEEQDTELFPEEGDNFISRSEFIQLSNKYILTPVKSGLMLIDQKLAYERILFEQFIFGLAHNRAIAQRELYPTRIDLDPEHYLLIREIKNDLAMLGIEIGDLGSNTIVVNSCPAGIESPELRDLVESLLEEYKQTGQKVGTSATAAVAASLAKAASANSQKLLQPAEMQQLVDELFACENPNYSPGGKRILNIIQTEELQKYLN